MAETTRIPECISFTPGIILGDSEKSYGCFSDPGRRCSGTHTAFKVDEGAAVAFVCARVYQNIPGHNVAVQNPFIEQISMAYEAPFNFIFG
jgi:hypothetical protein